MKRVLLLNVFLLAFLINNAQVVFNEFYPNPDLSKGRNEFIELYNTTEDPVELDCYSILAYDNINHKGYVYQLPKTTINPYSFVVITGSYESTPLVKYSSPTVTYSGANIISLNKTDDIGSFLKLYTKVGNALVAAPNTVTDDFLLDPSSGQGISLFLFNGSTIVNSFIGSGSPTLPSDFATLTTPLTFSTGVCTASINLSSISANQAELQSVISSTGSDNGYGRNADGLCGTWVKKSKTDDVTPGTTNGGTGSITSTIASVAAIGDCGATNTGNTLWNISITANSTAYLPATYSLYNDVDHNLMISPNDLPLGNGTINSTSSITLNNIAVPTGNALIVHVVASSGCISYYKAFEQNCTVTPVTFSNFHAQRNKQAVTLKWETASEQNNRGFNVQRNTRGLWETVAFVFSQADGGNSDELLSYEFKDANSEKGVSQYRIQQVDLDGKASFSAIRSVKGLEQAATRTVVYPNPSSDGKVSVVFEDQGAKAVTVSDMSGRIIRQYRSVLNNLQIEGLESGMYSIQVTDLSSAVSSTEKIIIKKR